MKEAMTEVVARGRWSGRPTVTLAVDLARVARITEPTEVHYASSAMSRLVIYVVDENSNGADLIETVLTGDGASIAINVIDPGWT